MGGVSKREQILNAIKATCENISVSNGFNNNVVQVVRRMLTFDNPAITFPVLMVLGAGETYEDQFDPETSSRLQIKIRGYSKDEAEPEVALNSLIRDVLQVLDNETYNPYHQYYKPISLDTDEGWLSTEMNGLALFELTIEIWFKFDRSNP